MSGLKISESERIVLQRALEIVSSAREDGRIDRREGLNLRSVAKKVLRVETGAWGVELVVHRRTRVIQLVEKVVLKLFMEENARGRGPPGLVPGIVGEISVKNA